MTLTPTTIAGIALSVRHGGGAINTAAGTHNRPPLIPGNVRVRGTNISPTFVSIDTPDDSSVWSAMWRVWDWNGRIKLQVDDAATVGNTVRMFGNTHVVSSGNISQATYLAQWTQFLDYAAGKGLYVYPCGGDLGHWGDTTYAQATDLYGAWATLLSGYDNVIGVDVTNEAWGYTQDLGDSPTVYGQPEPIITLLHDLGVIVRANAGVPVTHSFPLSDASWWTLDTDPLPQLFAISDFLDFHVYYASPTPAQAAAAFQKPWSTGKQILIGEFGLDLNSSSGTRTARYTDVKNIIASGPAFAGGLTWSCWDLGNSAELEFGLFDGARTLRTDISVPFATFPTTR